MNWENIIFTAIIVGLYAWNSFRLNRLQHRVYLLEITVESLSKWIGSVDKKTEKLDEIHRIASSGYFNEADKQEALELISEICAK